MAKEPEQEEPVRASSQAPTATPGTTSEEELKRARALAQFIERVDKKYGKGSLMPMSARTASFSQDRLFSTGCLTLDKALGGGIPMGRIVEIFGPESSGKSTLALFILAQAQKQKPHDRVVLVDLECAYDHSFGARIGIDRHKIMISQPDCGDDALGIVEDSCNSGLVSVIAVDSVAALIPRSELDRDVGDPTVGATARIMSSALRRIAQAAARSDTTVIFINQLRQKIGIIYGNPEVTTGGMSLKYYASQRIDLRKKAMIDGEKDGVARGLRVRAKVVKNKVAPPMGVAMFDILYDRGVDRVGDLLDAAVASGVVRKSGAHLFWDDEAGGGEVKLGHGREKAAAFLGDPENAELAARLEAVTREVFTGSYAGSASDTEDDVAPGGLGGDTLDAAKAL